MLNQDAAKWPTQVKRGDFELSAKGEDENTIVGSSGESTVGLEIEAQEIDLPLRPLATVILTIQSLIKRNPRYYQLR